MSQVWILAAILLPLLAGALLLLWPVENRSARNGLVMAVSLVTSLPGVSRHSCRAVAHCGALLL